MSNFRKIRWSALVCAWVPLLSWAAPGEDPITLTKTVEQLQLPLSNNAPAAQADSGVMPTNVKA